MWGERRGANRILVEKPNGMRPLGKCGYYGWYDTDIPEC
jgi:hypothetical protein